MSGILTPKSTITGRINHETMVGQVSKRGLDGISPVVEVEVVPGGHNVSITDINGKHTFFVPSGTSGEGGNASVYIGTEEPTDVNTNLWVDTDEEASGGLTEQDVEQIVREYAHTDDEINDLIDAKLGVIENGSY